MRNRSRKWERAAPGCAVAAVLLFVALLAGGRPAAARLKGTTELTVTVKQKERVTSGDTSRYLVFTDSETFEVTDTVWWLRWDSADLYGRLEQGKTYRVRAAGWRLPLFSWNRNIIAAEEVPAK